MIRVWFFILSSYSCSAVIYHLNDTEYQRMPPVFSLDEYEPCLDEEGSTYCMLQLNLYAEPENELMRLITEYSEHTLKHYNHSIIDRGVCIKSTCQNYIINSKTVEDLTGPLEACLNDSLRREYGLSAKLSTLYYCDHHNEPRHIDTWDWTVLVVILVLVIMNMVGSAYDYIVSKQTGKALENGNTFLLSFSVVRNWKRLSNTEPSDPRIRDLEFLNGLRVLLNVCTILLHTMMSFTIGFAGNPHDIEKAYESPPYKLVFNGMMVVQLFFFIAGFLQVYYLRLEEHKLTIWDIHKIVLQRLSRLVPALAMTLALSTSWVRHAGSGPLWKMFVSGSLVADCRNYWWRHLFFYNNYSPESKFCLVPTWQLAAEMQVFLVCVTAYVAARGRAGRVLPAALLLGAAAPALHTLLQDLDVAFVTPQSFRTLNVGGTFWIQHAPGHTNLPCFIMGMATAARLYDWQRQGSHRVQSRWYSLGQYVSFVSFFLILYTGSAFYMDGPRAPLLARVGYSFAIRLLLGFTCMVTFSSFFMKSPSYLKSIFEWWFWVVPSRLTYCVFLLHMILINMIMGSRMHLSHFSSYNIISTYLFIMVVSYIISVPFSLLVETPFIMLFKSLAKKETSKSTLSNKTQKRAPVVDGASVDETADETLTVNGAAVDNETVAANKNSTVNETSAVSGATVDKSFAANETSTVDGTSAVNGTTVDNDTSDGNGTSIVQRKTFNGTSDNSEILTTSATTSDCQTSNVHRARKEKTL